MDTRHIVSFDFDGVLTEQRFQDLAREIIKRGFDIIILTARGHFSSLEKGHGFNKDLYDVAESIGIPERNIIFTNHQDKYLFISPERVLFHIDDSDMEIIDMKMADKRFNVLKHTSHSNNEILDMLPVVFSNDRIDVLETSQANKMFHPYTCDGNGKCRSEDSYGRNLVPTQSGWVCKCREYRQRWAH